MPATTPTMAAEPEHICRFELTIDSVRYTIRPLDPDGWRLRKVGSRTSYVIRAGRTDPTCTCADFVRRKSPIGADCKHLGSFRKIRLIPPARS